MEETSEEAGDTGSSKGIDRPPGPAGLLTWMTVASGRTQFFDFVMELSEIHPISYAKLPSVQAYCLSDPEEIWSVFANGDDRLRMGPGLQDAEPIIGQGLLNKDGPEHQDRRATISDSLHRELGQQFAEAISGGIAELDARWSQSSERGNTEIDVVSEMSALVLDVLEKAIFGAELPKDGDLRPALEELLATFDKVLSPSGALLARFATRARRKLKDSVAQVDDTVLAVIAERREGVENGEAPSCVVSSLCRDSSGTTAQASGATAQASGATVDALTDSEIRDEAMALLMAGYATTTALLSWTWLELSLNTKSKVWALEEWDESHDTARSGSDDTARPGADDTARLGADDTARPGADDLSGLPRTRAVLAESMRLHPPSWVLVREVSKGFELCGFDVPEGSILLTSQYALHRDERFWESALEFVPDRWIDDSGAYGDRTPGQPRGAYFPFGFGDRRCLGDAIALNLAAATLVGLGRKWHVTPVAPGAVAAAAAATLMPAKGIPARIRRREFDREE